MREGAGGREREGEGREEGREEGRAREEETKRRLSMSGSITELRFEAQTCEVKQGGTKTNLCRRVLKHSLQTKRKKIIAAVKCNGKYAYKR